MIDMQKVQRAFFEHHNNGIAQFIELANIEDIHPPAHTSGHRRAGRVAEHSASASERV